MTQQVHFALLRATAATVIELLERDGSWGSAARHLRTLILEAEAEQRRTASEKPTTLSDSTRKAIALGMHRILEEISERTWAAGWMADLEFHVWRAVTRLEPVTTSMLEPDEIEALRELSALIDGWVDIDGYVPMADWIGRLEARAHA